MAEITHWHLCQKCPKELCNNYQGLDKYRKDPDFINWPSTEDVMLVACGKFRIYPPCCTQDNVFRVKWLGGKLKFYFDVFENGKSINSLVNFLLEQEYTDLESMLQLLKLKEEING